MYRIVATNELFTILIVISIALIAYAKLFTPKRFSDFISVLGNSKYLKIYARDQNFFDGFDAILFVNLILSTTIFFFLTYNNLIESIEISQTLMFKLAIGISVFILIKVLIERLIGSLFNVDKIIDAYLFQKMSYKNFIGICLIPINVVLIYSIHPSKEIFYVIIGLLLIINSIGVITSLKSNQNLIINNLFYFILYLCALEISPYVILYKFITIA